MWDYTVRFSFGPRPPVDEKQREEAATDANVAPSPPPAQTDSRSKSENGGTATTIHTNAPSTPVLPSSLAPSHTDSFEHLPLAHTVGPADNDAQAYILTHSFIITSEPVSDCPAEAANTVNMATTTRADTSTDSPSTATVAVNMVTTLTYPDNDDVAEGILWPMAAQLMKLKDTTAARMPPAGHLIKAKSQIQLVRMRLLPIGEFVVGYTNMLEEHERGAMEMRLCHHIAKHYWPLEATRTPAHLRIHEMYHNAIYRKNLQHPVNPLPKPLPAPVIAPTSINAATDDQSEASIGISSHTDISEKSTESVQFIGMRMLEKMVKVPALLSDKVSIKSHLSSSTTKSTTPADSKQSPDDDADDLDIDEVKLD